MNDLMDARRTKERSPNFPFIPLVLAIRRAEQFYEQERKATAPITSVAEHWGYSLKSSGLLQTVAALKSYGLLIDDGRGSQRRFKLSELALRILLDERPNSNEKFGFLQQAARTPAILDKIYDNWPDAQPSEPTLNHFLIFDMSFGRSAAIEVIKIFKENEELVRIYGSYIESPGAENVGDSKVVEIQTKAAQGQVMSAKLQEPLVGKQIGSIKVSPSCLMSISAEGIVTQAGLNKLIAYIDLIKDSFPVQEETFINLES
jgi:hypothetical protein